MYFVIEIGTLIKRFRLANKLAFYLTTCTWYTIALQKLPFLWAIVCDQRHAYK